LFGVLKTEKHVDSMLLDEKRAIINIEESIKKEAK